jgi:hypothetical protein
MSDYLSNLVDRSLDRADVIQPRLPSLFEPAQGIGSPITGLWQQPEPTAEIIEQSVPEVGNPYPVTRKSSPIARIFDRVMARRSAESLINPNLPSLSSQTTEIEVSQPLFRPQPESAQVGSVDRPDEPTSVPGSTFHPLSWQPQILDRQIAAGNVSIEQPEISTQPILDREQPIERSINNPDRSPKLNPTDISVQNPIDRIELSPLPTDLTPSQNPPLLGQMMERTTMEQIRSVIPAIQPEVVSNPLPAPVPTIQVTIGRIEVRATTAPATPAVTTARSKPPVMSLDEYLHQRGGGR